MLLDSVRELKSILKIDLPWPTLDLESGGVRSFALGATKIDALPMALPSLALGVAPVKDKQYRLAVRCQRPELLDSPEVEAMRKKAKGEIDVRFIGRLRRFTPWYQKRGRPLHIGQSCGHHTITAGTLGCFVRLLGQHTGPLHILSNNHVLAAENRGRNGDPILQPGRIDGGERPGDVIGLLARQVRLKRNATNYVDAAIARINSVTKVDELGLKDYGGKLAGVGDPFVDIGTRVAKQGRTTGLTLGRVTAFELDNVVVQFDAGNLRFDNQLEIEGEGDKAFSAGGDSGSLIFEQDTRVAVGLLFAGGDSGGSNGLGLTFANPIRAVLDLLKIQLA
jgi:hypothetical protein